MRRILYTILFPCLLLVSCSTFSIPNGNSPHQELDYSLIEDKLVEWKTIFDYKEPTYFYVYSIDCLHCSSIKERMINYALNNTNIYFVTYVSEINIYMNTELTIGSTRYEDVFIKGTPTLLYITDGYLKENIAGTTTILRELGI